MEYGVFKVGLDHIGNVHFRRTWPEESIRAVAGDVQNISDRAMVLITKRVFAEISPAAFPPLKRITDMLNEEQRKLNSANSPDEPKPRHVQDREFAQQFGGQHDEYVKRAWAIIMITVNPDVPREKLIEGLGVMDKTYPGQGWRERQADEIRRLNSQDGRNPQHYQEGA